MPTIPPSLNVQRILKEVLTKLDSGPPKYPTRWRFTLYKTHRKERTEKPHLYHPLPNKPTDTSTISECPTPHPLSPLPPPPPSQLMPLMDNHTLERPTKPSPTSSTINHMSDLLPLHPYHHTSRLQAIMNERTKGRKEIIRLLKNETQAINTLKKLINVIRANNKELEESYATAHPKATWGDQWTA